MTSPEPRLSEIVRKALEEVDYDQGDDEPGWMTALEVAAVVAAVEPLIAQARQAQWRPLTPEEQHLIDVYRQNKCGDPDCEGFRFAQAQNVLKGATTHREIADYVCDAMQLRSLNLPAPPARPIDKET